jgi:virginiamycin A acetyltransferase
MLITAPLRDKLREHGIATEFAGDFHLPDQSRFEPPCSLKRMQALFCLEMGAFSFARSGYYFGVKIGRYTSIDDAVQVGRGSHPVAWGTTSPLFYQDHRHVFNQAVVEAESFRSNAPPQKANITVIGHDVHIGHGALISQGVTIGNGAIIRPRTVITKDVPPFAVVAGNPGAITGMRFTTAQASRILELSWWQYAFWDLSGAPIGNPEAFLDHTERLIAEGMSPYRVAFLDVKSLD